MDGACVLMEERDQLVHVVAQERVYVALDELRLRFGERLSGIGYVAAPEGGARALQRAVHGGDGGVEAFGNFRRGPAEDLREEERRALLRREVLQRCYECEMDTLPQDHELGGVGIHRQRARIGHWLEPVGARQDRERVLDGTRRGGLHRARPPRPLGEQIEAHVGGDPVEPGAQRRAPVESVEASPCASMALAFLVTQCGPPWGKLVVDGDRVVPLLSGPARDRRCTVSAAPE